MEFAFGDSELTLIISGSPTFNFEELNASLQEDLYESDFFHQVCFPHLPMCLHSDQISSFYL